jgi:hypothetical protein
MDDDDDDDEEEEEEEEEEETTSGSVCWSSCDFQTIAQPFSYSIGS